MSEYQNKPKIVKPVLTPEQLQYIKTRKELAAATREAEKAESAHGKLCVEHLFVPTGQWEYFNKHWTINCGVKCVLCNYETGEWFCPKSTAHYPVCEYEGGDEYCINCGAPDERK